MRDDLYLREPACGAAGAFASLALLIALLATTTPVIGEVYKSIDASGRVQFSDKLVALRFDFPPGNHARLIQFARRVVAGI